MRQSLIITFFLATLVTPSILSARTREPIPKRAEERIAREVRHRVLMLSNYNVFDNITCKVEGYDVTLMGQVTDPVLKREVAKTVKQIEGVEKIRDQIEVLPVSGIDNQLRLRLYRAIYGYSALTRYALPVVKPIRIIVKNGHVDLEGVVDNQTDKNLVYTRANGVSGVFSVTNNLKVVKP